MGNRATVDLTKKLTEEQFVAVAQDMLALTQTPGWRLLLQLIEGARLGIMQLIHDPGVHKEYISGMLKAVDTIPENVAYVIERGKALAEKQADERENAKDRTLMPFVRPGGSTPAV